MKLRFVPVLLMASLLAIVTVAQEQRVPGRAEPVVVERGAHHRVWEGENPVNFSGDQAGARKFSFVELATGLHYFENGEWKESKEEIVSAPGGAGANQGAHKVFFAANLNTAGAIDLTQPDGARMRSHPLALAYFDPVKNESVVIAQIKDCVGEIQPPNQVLYRDAFNGGFRVDVRYTYTKAGLEQDIIIRERPPGAGQFSLSSESARLEVLTEFIEAPAPEVKVLSSSMEHPNQSIRVGAMRFMAGKAFELPDEAQSTWRQAVGKEWLQIGGRNLLSEALPLRQLRDKLEALPVKLAAVGNNPPVLAAIQAAPVTGRVLPTRPPLRETKQPLQVAARASSDGEGVVLDYVLAATSTNHTFKGDTTYLIRDVINLTGTTTFEGGAVLKYTNINFNTSTLTVDGPVTCLTGPYRPVIFTSYHDNTVGEVLPGSTGAATRMGYIPLNMGENISNTDFSYFHFWNLTRSLHLMGVVAEDLVFRHSQWRNCGDVFTAYGERTIRLRNALVAQCDSFLFLPGSETTIGLVGENVTLNGIGALVPIWEDATVNLDFYNSMIVAVSDLTPGYGGSHNAEYATTNDLFQTVGAGAHYLITSSTNRDTGTTNINAALLADLRAMTTYPPEVISNASLTSSTNLAPTAPRDIDTVDRGYHYAPIDWAVKDVTVTNCTLLLTNGVSVATFGNTGLLIRGAATVTSQGYPTAPNHLFRYYSVQEGQTNWGGGTTADGITLNPHTGGSTPGTVSLRFTGLHLLSGGGHHVFTTYNPYQLSALDLRDCQLAGGILALGHTNSIRLTNNLLERVFTDLYLVQDVGIGNNLFYGGTFATDFDSDPTPVIKNNTFDGTSVAQFGGAGDYGYNAYSEGATQLTPTNANDQVLATLGYNAGPLGRFYLTNNCPLLNAGSVMNAGQAGFYNYTTMTNQTIEAATRLDIGFHYMGVTASGDLVDSDLDGLGDDWERTHFGTLVMSGAGDPDQDAFTNLEEYLANTDPNSLPATAELKLWLKAGILTNLNSGDRVQTWTDASGLNNHASQSILAYRPFVFTNGLNGMRIVRFMANSNYLSLPNLMSGAPAGEALVVVKAGVDAPGWPRILLDMGTSGSGTRGHPHVANILDDFGNNVVRDAGDPAIPLDQFHIYDVSSTNAEWACRFNGLLQYRATNNTVSFNSSPTIGYSYLYNTFGGDIAEILIYDRVLTAAERDAVGRYLNTKYALVAMPEVPTGLTAQAVSSNQISLAWSGALTNAKVTFKVERKPSGGSYSEVATVEQASSYLDTGLTAGASYTYRIKAVNYAGESGYSAEASATTPSDWASMPLNGLRLWLRADAGVGSGYVSSWLDQSGQGNHGFQTTSAARPSTRTNAVNGRPAVRFTENSNYLSLPNLMSGAPAGEALVVVKAGVDAPGWPRILLTLGTSGSGSRGHPHVANILDDFGNNVVRDAGDPAIPLDQFHIYDVSSTNAEWACRFNGLLQYRATNNTVSFNSSPTIGYSYLPNTFGGDIAEILIYDRVLTSAEREAVGRYLNTKYALVAMPEVPTGLTAQAVSSNQISLAWSGALTNAQVAFKVERKPSGGSYSEVATVEQASSYLDTGLTAGASYTYRIKAVNYAGESGYSAEASATTPSDWASMPLTGLRLWLRADAGVGSGYVSSWADQSGQGNHAHQASAGSRPNTETNAINGRPAIRFWGDDFVEMANVLVGATQAEGFAVVKAQYDGGTNYNQILWGFGKTGSTFAGYPTTTGSVADDFGRTTVVTVGDPAQALDQPHIYNVSSRPAEWISRFNGIIQKTDALGVIGFPHESGWTYQIGRTSLGFGGVVAEVLVYDRVLAESERDAVGRYLNGKYGLIASLPGVPSGLKSVGHPPSSLTLTWTNTLPASGVTYIVERREGAAGSFSRVAYIQNTNVFEDTQVFPGTNYAYRVKALNYSGESAWSVTNCPPMTALTNPAAQLFVTQGTNITLSASASDLDGTISMVEFYEHFTLLGTDSSAPFSLTVSSLSAGTHSYYTKAYDNQTNVMFSAPVPVLASPDTDGDGIPDLQEILLGLNPNAADTDGDGVADNVDAFPLDPNRSTLPTVNNGDKTAPTINLSEPAGATLLP